MIRALVSATLLVLATSSAYGLNFSERDKQQHLAGSFALQSAGYGGLRLLGQSHKEALWKAAFLSMTAGMIKEITDPLPDREDLAADAIGIGAGMIIPVLIHEW
ncbi:MAG TPA: hypothetical protein VFV50_16155 [Bdellovibrionales bacterium]|nr:hypothetical protein [Bdellovibrionales bacterium]